MNSFEFELCGEGVFDRDVCNHHAFMHIFEKVSHSSRDVNGEGLHVNQVL